MGCPDTHVSKCVYTLILISAGLSSSKLHPASAARADQPTDRRDDDAGSDDDAVRPRGEYDF